MNFIGVYLFHILSLFDTKPVWNPNQEMKNQEIIEKINPIRNQAGVIDTFDIQIEIPKEYRKETVEINSCIFDAINNYKTLDPGEAININLEIKNNSQYNYSYEKNSFRLLTKTIGSNTKNTILGFDQKNISDNFLLYRSMNSAIENLYEADEMSIEKMLSNQMLDEKLQQKGYHGVDQLSVYYLDFYNEKYHLKKKGLEEFPKKVIKEIFSGEFSSEKESNQILIALAYLYYYRNTVFLTFPNQKEKSIFFYITKKPEIGSVKKTFKIIKKKEKAKLSNIILSTSKTNSIPSLNYQFQLDFKLNLTKK